MAQNWEMEYTEMITDAGLKQGSHSACVFYHEQKSIQIVAHGDDFAVLGADESLDWVRGVVQQRMEAMFKGRLERGTPGAVRILSRIATVTEHGLKCEANQRHADILLKDMGIEEGSEGVVAPGMSTSEPGEARGEIG